MKLRLRSIESKQTLRIEVPELCSFHQLKQTISDSVSSSATVPVTPAYLRLSLNCRDELHASSPNESIASLGITSGDRIFYTVENPQISNSVKSETLEASTCGVSMDEKPPASLEILIGVEDPPVAEEPKSVVMNSSNSVTLIGQGDLDVGESMGIDNDELNGGGGVVRKKYSVPFFLRRVMREEMAEDCSNHKLLVIALHAVLLESRFVRFDSVSGEQTDQVRLPNEWPAVGYTLSLSYTLPEIILRNRENGGGGGVEAVVLKFQTLGNFVNVYGSLASGGRGSGHHRVSLDVQSFAPMLYFVWGSRNVSDSEVFVPEIEIFEFWRIVKDGITYPLLIDLCAKADLPEPPSFMCLPLDLKMNILERLSGVDVAKVGCTCKEMQNLASKDKLWKQKCLEEFGSGVDGVGNWKFRFAGKWEEREQQKKALVMWREQPRPHHVMPIPFVPGFPGIIRDPPGFGVPDPFGRAPQLPNLLGRQPLIIRHGRRQNFSPNCNLGGGFSG